MFFFFCSKLKTEVLFLEYIKFQYLGYAKSMLPQIRCKGTKKNVYVQEKIVFIVIGYIF